MGYQLGIDLGTTFTAAATHRDGAAEMVALGNRAAALPSVLFVKDDDTLLAGEPAARRGLSEPGRMAREFKRRVGDTTPIMLGGAPYSADNLMARLLRWVVDSVSELEGGPPDRVVVCHPANWGPYKQDLLDQAIRQADLPVTTTITEPEAAATYYASTERVEAGAVVAVYDLGGGTFDAAVLRKHDEGWEILGQPEGVERLGGIDFDEAVFEHVRGSLGGALDELDPADPATLTAVTRLREDTTAAKEALSADTDTGIPVVLPNLSTEIRLTRGEFEAMVRPMLLETVEALRRALRSADVDPGEVDKILLLGGSSRIPMVGEIVARELGRPVAVDAHPKHAIALGAALAAAQAAGAPAGAASITTGGGSTRTNVPRHNSGGAKSGRRRRALAAGAVLGAVALGGVALATRGGDSSGSDAESSPSTTESFGESATGETIATLGESVTVDSTCDLLSEAEAEAPLGADFSTTTDDDSTCLYESADHLTYVSVTLQPGSGFMNEAQARSITRSIPGGDEAEEIEGIGDLALFHFVDFSSTGFGLGANEGVHARATRGGSSTVEYYLQLLANKTMVTVTLAGAADIDGAKTALTQWGELIASRL